MIFGQRIKSLNEYGLFKGNRPTKNKTMAVELYYCIIEYNNRQIKNLDCLSLEVRMNRFFL